MLFWCLHYDLGDLYSIDFFDIYEHSLLAHVWNIRYVTIINN